MIYYDYYYQSMDCNLRMKEESGRKRRRLYNEEEDEKTETAAAAADCISGLPDHLLHEILACLPIRIAVSTSLLSRRWRTVWTTSRDLSFTRLSPCFVDSVLRLRDPAVSLRSFSLVSSSNDTVPDPSRLPSWIRYLDSSALQCLTIRTCGFGLVPPEVFRLSSLRVLELAFPGGTTQVDWPATAFLPSLQRLELGRLTLRLPAGDAISRSCPALKYCRMSLYAAATPELDVSCPLLEVFELTTRVRQAGCISIRGSSVREVRVRQRFARAAPAYLKLSAPGLRTLEWIGPLPHTAAVNAGSLLSTLVMRTDGTVVELDLKNVLLEGGGGHKFSMLRVNRLILPEYSVTMVLGKLVFDQGNQVNPHDQGYENLKHLQLSAYFGGFGSLGVAFLLRMFSKIETLHISLSRVYIKYSSQDEDFCHYFKAKGGFGKGGYWDSHNICLEKLVRVYMRYFTGERYEYDFLEFLFRMATSLRKITISFDSQANLFLKEILQRMERLRQSFPHIKIVIS